MQRVTILACCVLVGSAGAMVAHSQSRGSSGAAIYEGARLLVGDGAVIEDGAFAVRDGRITAVGRRGSVAAPAGAARVDLTGRTVMPALINAHVHIGYEGYTTWGAGNYTAQNVLNHLQREAFYGVGATQSVGSSPLEPSMQFVRDQQAGRFPPASRFFFMPGMAPPNGGPDAILMKGTSVLHAVYEVSTAQEARAAVRMMAGRQLKHVKIWVDDRRGTYPKMTPEVYNAVIDEAHAHHMLVHAHAIAMADSEGGRPRGRRRSRAHRRERAAGRRARRADRGEEALLDHRDRPRRSQRGVRRRSVRRSDVSRAGARRDSRDRLRAGVAERRHARGGARQQRAEDGRGGRAAGARHRCRHHVPPRVRLGRSPRDGALGGAGGDAGAGDRRGHLEAGGTARHHRHGHAGGGERARGLHRAHRQPARRHPQHAPDRERLPSRRAARSRRAGRDVPERRCAPR